MEGRSCDFTRYYRSISMERVENTMKTLGHDGRPPDRDSKPLPVEFEVRV